MLIVGLYFHVESGVRLLVRLEGLLEGGLLVTSGFRVQLLTFVN